MFKIKDKITLGLAAGVVGDLMKSAVGRISGGSQRSPRGPVTGMLKLGLGALGGIGAVQLLSKTGGDHLVTKGLISGVTIGSMDSLITGTVLSDKANSPKASVLTTIIGSAAYGVAAVYTAAKLGHPSLFEGAEEGGSGHDEIVSDRNETSPEEAERAKTKIISLAKLRKPRTVRYL